MAAVSVTFDGTRVNAADTATNPPWTAPGAEVEFVYQGTASMSLQVKTTEAGFYYYNSGTSHNFSTGAGSVWLAKAWVTNYGALDGNGLILEIGTGARSAYYRYFIYSATTYPRLGGWCLLPIDPNISGYRSATTGSPNLTTINFYGIRADFSLSSKTQNVGMDAIDFITSGTGLTLVGGDSTDADGTFQSFIDFDEGTSGNRYSVVTTRDGVIYVQGVLTIGTATATVFTDSNQTIVFLTGRFNTGFCGIDINLASATTVINMSAINMIGRGSLNYLGSGCDTRPDFTVTNTSGSATFDACTWNNFRNIDFNSKCAITDSTFYKCLSITPAQGTLTNCVIEASPCATNTACVTAADITDITYCSFISGGTGHALVISSTTGSPFTFVGNTFSGYSGTAGTNLTASSGSSEAAIYNNSGGAITINITAGGTTPSVRNGAGASTTINNNVNLTVTVQDAGANPIPGAQVAVYKTSDNSTIITSTGANATGVVSGSVAASTGAIYIRVRQSSAAATFLTSSTGIDAATEVITTTIAHSFVDGEAVVYRKNGGSAAVGLTESTTYYVNAISTTTLSLHTTAANAIADSSRVNLNTSGTETHQLDPIRYYPNSTVGTIGTVDFDVTITMIEDTTVTG